MRNNTPMTEAVIEPDLTICDPHHHLWIREPYGHYLLEQFVDDIATGGHNIESTIFVEAHAFYSPLRPPGFEFVSETEVMTGVAAMSESGHYGSTRVCAGIVGRCELQLGGPVTAEVLEAHIRVAGDRFKGVRASGSWHPNPSIRSSHTRPPPHLYLQPNFRDGFAQLHRYGMSFEAWQYHTQLDDVADLARAFPETPIMLNHVGGPLGVGPYKGKLDEVFADWSRDLPAVAACPNVYVKLGGLGMLVCGFEFHKQEPLPGSEALAQAWRPYIETCIEAFGVNRCVFESNYPVDGASCSYGILWNALKRIASGCSVEEKTKLFRDNAMKFYQLKL